jgi:hypothetical protein
MIFSIFRDCEFCGHDTLDLKDSIKDIFGGVWYTVECPGCDGMYAIKKEELE